MARRRGSFSPHSGGTVPDSHRVPLPLAGFAGEPIIGRVPRRRTLSLWLPVVAWAALIFGLSSISGLNSGLGTWDLVLRKLAHMTEFAILAALLVRALARELPAFLVAVAYAVSDEAHQHFVPGRQGSSLDVAIDAAGALAGVLVARRFVLRATA